VHCTVVRGRADVEFDIDIHHWCGLKWCWLKWWDSLRCSPVPVVEPHKCPERAYAYNHRRSMQPRIKVDILIEPPKQHSRPNTEPSGGSGEIAQAQMADRVEPCGNGEVKRAQIEQHHGAEYYRNELPHFPSQKFSLL
jgi:hypothetical protein